jgi:hypothetical protein
MDLQPHTVADLSYYIIPRVQILVSGGVFQIALENYRFREYTLLSVLARLQYVSIVLTIRYNRTHLKY